jgi:hypothetical protein
MCDEAVVGPVDVGDVERHQLGGPERSGEADDEDRPVPQADQQVEVELPEAELWGSAHAPSPVLFCAHLRANALGL